MSAITDALKHTAGNIEKAQIRISTYNTVDQKKLKILDYVPMKGSAQLSAALGTAASSMTQTIQNAAAARLNEVREDKVFTVQFNPNRLTLSGYGGGMYQKTDYGIAGNAKKQQRNIGISFEPAKVRLMMNVTLIFDQVSVKDAFMADKIAASPTSIATGGMTLAKETITGQEYSVQPIIEGFIGMLRQERTRFVTFCWGSMQYEGIVNNLETSYTMFNLTGQPIRGEVQMSMVLVDEEVGPNNMGIWKQHYEEAFGGGNVSYRDKTQYVGNLINL